MNPNTYTPSGRSSSSSYFQIDHPYETEDDRKACAQLIAELFRQGAQLEVEISLDGLHCMIHMSRY